MSMLQINSGTIEDEITADMSVLQLDTVTAIEEEDNRVNGDESDDLLAWLYDYASRG